jgi:hypothetical protein
VRLSRGECSAWAGERYLSAPRDRRISLQHNMIMNMYYLIGSPLNSIRRIGHDRVAGREGGAANIIGSSIAAVFRDLPERHCGEVLWRAGLGGVGPCARAGQLGNDVAGAAERGRVMSEMVGYPKRRCACRMWGTPKAHPQGDPSRCLSEISWTEYEKKSDEFGLAVCVGLVEDVLYMGANRPK